jgi:hypothetical protein
MFGFLVAIGAFVAGVLYAIYVFVRMIEKVFR